MFSLHVFGNSPAPSVIGRISDQLHCSIAFALQAAIIAFGISGTLFLMVARRQRLLPSPHES